VIGLAGERQRGESGCLASPPNIQEVVLKTGCGGRAGRGWCVCRSSARSAGAAASSRSAADAAVMFEAFLPGAARRPQAVILLCERALGAITAGLPGVEFRSNLPWRGEPEAPRSHAERAIWRRAGPALQAGRSVFSLAIDVIGERPSAEHQRHQPHRHSAEIERLGLCRGRPHHGALC